MPLAGARLEARKKCGAARMVNEPPVVVTVLIVTYNHARYIAAAIDSALRQRADFAIEILISEDCSTDGTREIIQRYVADYPDKLTAIYSDHNVRSNEVVARGLRRARGRYVSMLDGDDFWVSDTKLRDQAAYLDAHPEVSAFFHNAVVAEGDTITGMRWTRRDQQAIVTKEDIWEGNPFATCAGMMRSSCIRDVPAWYADFFPMTDWPLYALCSKVGNLAFVDETVGVYRLHSGGLVSGLQGRSKFDLMEGFYRRMAEVMEPATVRSVRRGCSRYFFEWSKRYLAEGDVACARSCLLRCLRSGGFGRGSRRRDIVKLGLRVLASSVSRK
jgi:glycosyltransferase involved in cell wall biosynthesis